MCDADFGVGWLLMMQLAAGQCHQTPTLYTVAGQLLTTSNNNTWEIKEISLCNERGKMIYAFLCLLFPNTPLLSSILRNAHSRGNQDACLLACLLHLKGRVWDSQKRRAEIAKWKRTIGMRGLGLYGSKWESSEEAQAGVHCVNFSKNNPATRDWRGRGGTGGWERN
jgi:hypothetical protein